MRVALAALLLCLAGPGVAADRGAEIAATCAACHGPDGRPDGIPVIAGADAETLRQAMLAYRASERPSHIMHAIALSLGDEEIARVAAYLAGLK